MSEKELRISRVTRTKEEAKANYNKISKWYDFIASSEKKFKDIGLKTLKTQPGESVLELGFGTGYCIALLAQEVKDTGKVYGVDLSEGMLTIAQKRIDKALLTKRVELHCEDATTLPFPDGFFQAIFTSFTLELFDTPEIPLVLKECWRVLQNEGRFCVVTLGKEGCDSWPVRLYEWAHKKFPKLVDCRPIDGKSDLEKAHFQISNITKKKMWGLPVEIILARKNLSSIAK